MEKHKFDDASCVELTDIKVYFCSCGAFAINESKYSSVILGYIKLSNGKIRRTEYCEEHILKSVL